MQARPVSAPFCLTAPLGVLLRSASEIDVKPLALITRDRKPTTFVVDMEVAP
jgi:hypothetical protein